MSLRIGEAFPKIKEFLEQCSKHAIDVCAKQCDNCQDLVVDPSSDRHFKHVWNEIVLIIEKPNEPNIHKRFEKIFYLTRFTPEYGNEYLAYYTEDRVKIMVMRLLLFPKSREYVFHSFVQILMQQKPSVAVKYASLVDDCVTVMKIPDLTKYTNKVSTFFRSMEALETEKSLEHALVAIQFIDEYVRYRKSLTHIPGLEPTFLLHVFVPVIRVLSEVNGAFSAEHLVKLIRAEPILLYIMEFEQTPVTGFGQLPPLSLLADTVGKVDIEFRLLVMYRPIILRVLECILHFRAASVSIDVIDELVCVFHNMFNAVISGPAGRDAFSLVLSYCDGHPLLSTCLANFVAFCGSGRYKRAQSIGAACIVSAFDIDLYPSVISLIEQKKDIISDLLTSICNGYEDSPINAKAVRLKQLFEGQRPGADTLHRAIQIAHSIARGNPVPDDVMDVISYCADRIFRAEYFVAFAQLISVAFKKFAPCIANVTTAAVLAGRLLPLFNDIENWHVLNLWKQRALFSLARSTTPTGLRLVLQKMVSPISDFGACLLLTECVIPYPDKMASLMEACPDICGVMAERCAISELACATRLLCRLFDDRNVFPSNTLEAMKSVLLRAPERKWRYFVRLAAPFLQRSSFVNFLFEGDGIEILLIEVVKMLKSTNCEEVFASKSLVLFWKTIGCHPGAGGVAEHLAAIVLPSACLTFKAPQQKIYFYDAFYDVVMNIGRGFLKYFAHPILSVDDYLMAFLLKLPADVANAYITEHCPPLAGMDLPPREYSPKNVVCNVWPLSDWISEVTGIAYHAVVPV